jgi:hypothetical protein
MNLNYMAAFFFPAVPDYSYTFGDRYCDARSQDMASDRGDFCSGCGSAFLHSPPVKPQFIDLLLLQ